MDLKKYEKTRYQSIYRNKKNKNYVVMLSKPVKSSISRIDGKKITTLEEALKIRDNPKIRLQKANETIHKEEFDFLLDKYMKYCEKDLKLSYNSLKKKRILFDKYFRGRFKKISAVKKEILSSYINNLSCSDKQKNEVIKIIRPFFNWCVREDILFKSPLTGVKLYRVNKPEMKYWLPEDIRTILSVIDDDINNEPTTKKHRAYLVKMIILIGFSLGDRIGETRALRFSDINEEECSISIKHSINYDPKAESFLSATKTLSSEKSIFVTEKLLSAIFEYRSFIVNELNIEITDNTPILVNPKTNLPFCDTLLRRHFNYYIKKSNVRKIRMYDLRHTTATTLMSEGYDMYIIQDKLRHKSIKTTIDEYGHITSNKRKEVAKVTDKYY